MTVINPYYLQLDDLILATFSHHVETLTGLRTVPQRRRKTRYTASRHGSDDFDPFFDELRLPIDISLWPWDEDGGEVAVFGAVGQLQANWDDLVAVVTKRGPVDVRQTLPVVDPEESGESVLEVQAYGRFDRTVMATTSHSRWRISTDLVLPWPFWHELPKVELAADTSHSFITGGTAPIANMRLIFSEDATVTHTETGHKIGIEGMDGTQVIVDVRQRKVFQDGQLAMGLLRLDGPDYWMEWPARSQVTLSASAPVAVEFWNCRL